MQINFNQLIQQQNNQMVTTSLDVAKVFDKWHKTVIKDVEKVAEQNYSTKNMFAKSTYLNRGKKYPMYYMNRDGFSLIAMGFTGEKALKFKVQYVNAFNQMESQLQKKPLTATEQLKLNSASIMEIDDRVTHLEDNMRMSSANQLTIQKSGKHKVISELGGKKSNAYRLYSKKAFAQMWRDFKEHFEIPRYPDLPQKQFQSGKEFISFWQPDNELRFNIKQANDQGDLF